MLKIHIAKKPTPRLPPVEDVNNTDLMLGVVLLGLVMAFVLGVIIWAFVR